MFRFLSTFGRTLWSGRWGQAAALVACLGLPGCANLDLRGEGFRNDTTSENFRQARPREPDSEFWGFSNKARQIEQDVGF